jgi:hypothetical protein
MALSKPADAANLIIHIMRKDWKLLWPLALLVTAIQILLGWLSFRWGYFGEDFVARTLFPALSAAWNLGIAALVVATVHQDPIPGISQDWLIRPVRRRDLLCAKVLFVIVTISVPMLVVDLINARAAGFTLSQALGPATVKEIYILLTLVVPLLALASVTENWPQIVLGAAILVVLFALCLIGASFAIGAGRCPTCGTGLRWIQSLLEHGAVLVGALLILGLQYFHRQTSWARGLIAGGLILFALVQLPWNIAFAIQQRLSAAPGDATAVAIAFDPTAEKAVIAPSRPASVMGAAVAAHALLRGNTDDIAEFLRRRALSDAARVTFTLPLRITGVPDGGELQVDRSEYRLLGPDDQILYDAANGGESAGLDIASGAGTSHQMIEVPVALYRQWAQRPVRIEITYSLTLLRATGTYAMAATAGYLESRELGRCASRLNSDTTKINVRCRQVGLGPTCVAATLEGPTGRRNPETQDCTPDYRPFAVLGAVPLNIFGVDVPVRDNTGLVEYPVPSAQIPESRLLLTPYSVRDHFMRTLMTPALMLADWQAQLR